MVVLLLTHIGIHSEHVTVMLLCFGILRYVSEHPSLLWVLRYVRYVPHVVIAYHDLCKKSYILGITILTEKPRKNP